MLQYRQTARIILVLATFVSFAGFVCDDISTNVIDIPVGDKTEIWLSEGKTVELGPETVVVKFFKVKGDSRCPIDVVCVWQGEAEITITVQNSRGRPEQFNVKIPGLVDTPYRGDSFEASGYRFTLLQLDPYPNTQERNTPRSYVARLEIEKLQ